MAEHSQNAVGHLAVYPTWGGAHLLPMLSGSGHDEGRAFAKRMPSTSRAGATAAIERVRRPTIDVVTRAYDSWFNAVTLQRMFTKDRSTGQLLSWGRVQVRVGGGETYAYAAVKVDAFLMRWAETGSFLEITMRLSPYGRRIPARRVPRMTDFGPPYQGRGVTYGGGVSSVAMGWVRVDNRLRADLSEPRAQSSDGAEYPIDYLSDFYSVTAGIARYTGGVPAQSNGGDLAITFRNAPKTRGVAWRLFGVPPSKTAPHGAPGAPAIEMRSYDTLQPDAARDLLRFRQL